MVAYVTVEDLVRSVGSSRLLVLLDHHLDGAADLSLDEPAAQAALTQAIAAAQGLAESHLGQRYTPAQVQAAGQSEAVRACVIDIAVYRLAPSTLPQSEESTNRYKQALRDLEAIGKGLRSAGSTDPSPAPSHAQLVGPTALRNHW